LSSAEVASSSISILGFFRNNLAIASLCFSHQLSFSHLSQISVSIQFSKSNTKFASAFFIFVSSISISPCFSSQNLSNKFIIVDFQAHVSHTKAIFSHDLTTNERFFIIFFLL
jgi:hypothetical protein